MNQSSRCTKCFQELEPGAKFCGACGTAVAQPVEQRSTPPPPAAVSVECPSCHHRNYSSSRFCERCGTELEATQTAVPTTQQSYSHSASEDPWATGPGYENSADPDFACERCGVQRRPADSACSNCGLPFEQLNRNGVPPAVARTGQPSGFWIRLVAAIIDFIIIIVASFLVAIAGFLLGDRGAGATGLIQFLIFLLYGPVLLSLYGTTAGKKIFNIYVLDPKGNHKLNFFRAFLREIVKFVSFFFFLFLISFVMMGVRRDKRAMHDMLAVTYPTSV